MRILAISDIHGCLNTFKALLQQIQFSKTDHLFLVGDFIDRGPDSKGVIDHILELQEKGFTITCLRGNHEEMLLKGFYKRKDDPLWLFHGGEETLASFNAPTTQEIPNEYISWMENLPLYQEHKEYIFVHAGLNFDPPNPLEAEHSMLWIRDWYRTINYEWLKNRIIIHGHTPIGKKDIEKMFDKIDKRQVLNIDGGCVFDYKGLGNLCVVDLTNRKLVFHACFRYSKRTKTN